MISLSQHFIKRQEQRGLKKNVLNFILEFGEISTARRATWLLVMRKNLPYNLRNSSLAMRASQWIVMIKGGILVTCYRVDNPIRHLTISH